MLSTLQGCPGFATTSSILRSLPLTFDNTVAQDSVHGPASFVICPPIAEYKMVDDQVAGFRYAKHPAMQFKQQWYTWTARNWAGNRNQEKLFKAILNYTLPKLLYFGFW